MDEKKDIFDRIMSWGFLRRFEPFYKAHKEVLLYLLFGGLTTLVGIIFFAIPVRLLRPSSGEILDARLDYRAIEANVISWICAVTFAYVTNRAWVFADKAYGAAGVAKECAAFFAGRLFTLIVETLLLNLCIAAIGMGELIAKILVSVVTVILNYVISKLIVVRKQA